EPLEQELAEERVVEVDRLAGVAPGDEEAPAVVRLEQAPHLRLAGERAEDPRADERRKRAREHGASQVGRELREQLAGEVVEDRARRGGLADVPRPPPGRRGPVPPSM